MERNDISYLVMKACVIGALIIISCLSVSCGQTSLCQLSVFKNSSILSGRDTVEMFTLVNANGMSVQVTNYAASLTDVFVPDRQGRFEHVVLGFDSLECYLGRHPKLGATVGRFANRIKNAEFCLNGQTYHLEKNNNGHSIHGGTNGFSHRIFKTDTFYVVKDTAIVVFKYSSIHLEEGFPGNLELSMAYKLTNHNEIVLEYTATTDKPTVVNFTNHSYFNLDGHNSGTILKHYMEIYSGQMLELGNDMIPTGEIIDISDTPFDFRKSKQIGKDIDADNSQIKIAGGYDHNYIFPNDRKTRKVAKLYGADSGIRMDVYSDLCGLQVYTGNYLNGQIGKDGAIYNKRSGVCFETQFYPNSCNNPEFPSCILPAYKIFKSRTVYQFFA